MAVTKQSQLCFVLYMNHILHAGSVTVISKQQKVREKRRGLLFGQTPIYTLFFQKQCTCQIARFGNGYPLFIVL